MIKFYDIGRKEDVEIKYSDIDYMNGNEDGIEVVDVDGHKYYANIVVFTKGE